VACVEELQSLVTHLIHFTHRKIQVIAKPTVVLLTTKMSYMSEILLIVTLYFYMLFLQGPLFWPTVCCRSELQSVASGLVWLVMNC